MADVLHRNLIPMSGLIIRAIHFAIFNTPPGSYFTTIVRSSWKWAINNFLEKCPTLTALSIIAALHLPNDWADNQEHLCSIHTPPACSKQHDIRGWVSRSGQEVMTQHRMRCYYVKKIVVFWSPLCHLILATNHFPLIIATKCMNWLLLKWWASYGNALELWSVMLWVESVLSFVEVAITQCWWPQNRRYGHQLGREIPQQDMEL